MEEVPFEDRHVPKAEIDWDRSVWWWYPLTRSIHPSIKLTTLVASLLAMLLAFAGIALAVLVFGPTTDSGAAWQPSLVALQEGQYPTLPLKSPMMGWLSEAYGQLSLLNFGVRELAFLSFIFLWLTAVFAILGGVLARRSMVELGQRTIAPWGESFAIVLSRSHSYLWATGMHLVAIALLSIPVLVLGVIARAGDIGGHIAGLLMLLAFPLVFAFGRLLLSMLLCFPMSVCAITAEKKADAFEGFSRSNAYVFQRPVVAVLCIFVLTLVGLIGEQLIYWTVFLGWSLMKNGFALAAGEAAEAAADYLGIGDWICVSLLSAFWFSFFWAASAAVYLILRRSVDSTELDELDSLENPVETSLPEIPNSPPTGAAEEASNGSHSSPEV